MMRLDILCLFPDTIAPFFKESMLWRAQDKKIVEIYLHNIRDYAVPPRYKVDDQAYGGVAGMVLKPEPLAACIDNLKNQYQYDQIIYLTPDGLPLTQNYCNTLSLYQNLMIICGHYKGIDQRIRDEYVTQEISIGDYVLTAGELSAAVLVDAVVRLIPGVLNDASAALEDSFQDGLLAPAVYTRPAIWRNREVPTILRSGHAQQILDWHYKESVEKTQKRRPDLLTKL